MPKICDIRIFFRILKLSIFLIFCSISCLASLWFGASTTPTYRVGYKKVIVKYINNDYVSFYLFGL